jgi:hypothetical protein
MDYVTYVEVGLVSVEKIGEYMNNPIENINEKPTTANQIY